MKKIFIAVLAVAALASCSQEYVVVEQPKAAIGFDTFVENSTRATDLTTSNLQDFGVYGTVAKGGNTALIFKNTKVYKSGNVYKYDVPQYWIAEADYTFTAIAPYTDAEWSYDPATTTLSFDNAAAAAEQDVLFAYAAKTTEEELTEENTQPVAFIFKHVLSKVAFKFTNTFADGNTSLKVYNVKINNTALEATMPIVDGVDKVWTAETDDNDLVVAFGEAAANNVDLFGNGESFPVAHQYVIPVERKYVITFDVDLYQAGVYLATYSHEIEKTINFAKNGNYSLNVELAPGTVNPDAQLYPIVFTVDKIDDWDSTNGNVALNN